MTHCGSMWARALALVCGFISGVSAFAPHHFTDRANPTRLFSAVGTKDSTSPAGPDAVTCPSPALGRRIVELFHQALPEGRQWATEFGFSQDSAGFSEDSSKDSPKAPEASFYALFRAIRLLEQECSNNSSAGNDKPMGLSGTPFYIPSSLLEQISNKAFINYFHFQHLANALEEDFLDAQRGSTDNRKGWQVTAVSQPLGTSFQDAKMSLSQVKTALHSGTVIFNNIGAHIPRLASPTLACTDALALPGAVNMYVTARGMRTSAPPHTDRQDVVVVQMEGAKRWRVFSPPLDGHVKPTADPFARGKGDDSLPLHSLLDGSRYKSNLLMDVVTREGDVLFIPAGFPHTTDTVDETTDIDYDTSIHLTFNIDTHVWDLDYLSVRHAALQRNGVRDILSTSDNRYTGKVNELPSGLRSQLMEALPFNFIDETIQQDEQEMIDFIAQRLETLCAKVDDATHTPATVSLEAYQEALLRIRSYGMSILDIHRDMYLAAIEEGRLRKAEAAMTAHLKSIAMTPERMQRLSLFRVRPFFEKIDLAKKELQQWCASGTTLASLTSTSSELDANWQFTTDLKVGDAVEADLGGAFFDAKISQIVNSGGIQRYNVIFFDGDRADGLARNEIRLLTPPKASKLQNDEEIDTTGLTPKEIKRLKKKMKKKNA